MELFIHWKWNDETRVKSMLADLQLAPHAITDEVLSKYMDSVVSSAFTGLPSDSRIFVEWAEIRTAKGRVLYRQTRHNFMPT